MSLKYSIIEIFTSEEVKYKGNVLYESLMEYIRSLKIAARCMVTRGTDVCYETGEIVTRKIMNLSYNMPLKIEIILPSSELDQVLPVLENMVSDGILGVRELKICCHKTRRHLFPRQIRVKDVMTSHPEKAGINEPVDKVIRLMLSSTFTGIPVVNEKNIPVGVISQGDLIYKAKMPIRLALMAKTDKESLDNVLNPLSQIKAQDIMTSPAVTINMYEFLTKAVNLMLEKNVKRLPVADGEGKLAGILSRMDIFQTITRESPDWESIKKRDIDVENPCFVSDIMHRETNTVLPDASAEEIIHIIDSDDIQRVAVVREDGLFLGIISDEDLLSVFSDEHLSIWAYLTGKTLFTEKSGEKTRLKMKMQGKNASQIMKTDVITILENTPVDEAIALMTEKELKRLPVLDGEGKYKGMISRESLLRAGFSGE